MAGLKQDNPQATRLDTWLSLSRFNWRYSKAKVNDEKGHWSHDRKGWIVPIPVGYGALGARQPAGSVANARDADTPFCFVESLYSIGEWVGVHRLCQVNDLLWYADSQSDVGRYVCHNDYQSNH